MGTFLFFSLSPVEPGVIIYCCCCCRVIAAASDISLLLYSLVLKWLRLSVLALSLETGGVFCSVAVPSGAR